MIVDRIENLKRYASLNPLFSDVIEYLNSHNLVEEDFGKQHLKGKDLFVNIQHTAPKAKDKATLETHVLFIDIQIPLSGEETFGYTPTANLGEEIQHYDTEKDITFFKGLAESYFVLKPGMFAIFFPQDGHAPGITPTGVRKAVIKVRIQG